MEISEKRIEKGPKTHENEKTHAKPWAKWLGIPAVALAFGCSNQAVQDNIPIPIVDAAVDSGKTTKDSGQETKGSDGNASDGDAVSDSGSAIESDGGSGTEVNVAGIDAMEDRPNGVGSINPQDGSATDVPGSVSDTTLANSPDLASVKTVDAENLGVDVAPDQIISLDTSAVDISSKANDGQIGEAGGTIDAYAVDSEGSACQGASTTFKDYMNLDQPLQYGSWTITYKGIVATDGGASMYDLSFACGNGPATDQLLPGGVSKIDGLTVILSSGGRSAVFATISSN